MLKNFPPIHLYVLPILFFLAGGAVFYWTGWVWASGFIYFVGVVSTIHLISHDVLEKAKELWWEKTNMYEALSKLPSELRFAEGAGDIPDHLKVTVDQTGAVGNEFSHLYRKLSLSPQRMSIIARASMNGTPFTIRQWTGDGKLLSDPEWRQLKDELVDCGFLAQRNERDVHAGFEWTELGKQMLEQCVSTPLSYS
jgi:hypothetical protein